jgi:hypothetical protein
LEPETKKRLLYGVVIVVAGGVGIFIWKKYGSGGSSAAASAASADANAQSQASAEETQLAELSELGSSGSSLASHNIGETPVEDFGDELTQVLQAVGLEPMGTTQGSGTTPASPVSTAPGATGTSTTGPPVTTAPVKPPASSPVAPIITGPVRATGGPIFYTGTMPEQIVNPE